MIAVRTRSKRSLTPPVAVAALRELDIGALVIVFPDAGMEIYPMSVRPTVLQI